GAGMVAWPLRWSVGPTVRTARRFLLPRLRGTTVDWLCDVRNATLASPVQGTSEPSARMTCSVRVVSPRLRGALCRVQRSSVSIEATMSLVTAFLAPLRYTSPRSGTPPSITYCTCPPLSHTSGACSGSPSLISDPLLVADALVTQRRPP